jgi:hypothetical protein
VKHPTKQEVRSGSGVADKRIDRVAFRQDPRFDDTTFEEGKDRSELLDLIFRNE